MNTYSFEIYYFENLTVEFFKVIATLLIIITLRIISLKFISFNNIPNKMDTQLQVQLNYIESDDLANIILRKSNQIVLSSTKEEKILNVEDMIIIDVRSIEEYKEGHIRNAINLSSDHWSDESFIDKTIKRCEKYQHIIFHCAKSQVRGPTCARLFKQRLNSNNNLNIALKPSIYVLHYGFEYFSRKYSSDKDLIEIPLH